ncbi:hypothetical protein GF378_02770 [Candidatus Pacearchaeota archaeon]|nr:hypothetical protein [Candidatus Pacearchaeota archaeon]
MKNKTRSKTKSKLERKSKSSPKSKPKSKSENKPKSKSRSKQKTKQKRKKSSEKVFPKTIKAENLRERVYLQRGRYHFLVYNLDGSISGQNSGLYLPPISFLSKLKFFVKIGKRWRNLHKHLKEVKINSFDTVHFYEIKGVKISIEIFLSDNHPILRFFIKSNKKIDLRLKPVIDFSFIAGYHETPLKGYTFEKKKRQSKGNSLGKKEKNAEKKTKKNLIITSSFENKTNLMINSNREVKVNNKKSKIKSMDVNLKKSLVNEINVICSETSERGLYEAFDEIKKDNRKTKRKRYENHIYQEVDFKSDNSDLNKAFQFAKYNMLQLRHRQSGVGRGFLAGAPWFLSFFGRDTFWSVPGALMLGDFENVKDCLNMFAKYQSKVSTESKKPGKIPHEIWLNGEPNYYSTDASMLFIMSILWYYNHTGDKNYLTEIFPTVKNSAQFLFSVLEKGRINHGKLGFLKDTTWMDSYNRGKTALEMQALVVSCFDSILKITEIIGSKKHKSFIKKIKSQKKKAEKQLRKFKRKNGWWVDHINKNNTASKSYTANPLFLLALNRVSKSEARETIKFLEGVELFSDYGVRSRAKKSQGYVPAKYHKGAIWPFLTGIYFIGASNYNLDYSKKDEKILDAFLKYYTEYSYGLAPECLHGNNFSRKIKHPSVLLESRKNSNESSSSESFSVHTHCFLFLWSSALFVQAIMQRICGIHISKAGKLNVKPNLPPSINEITIKNFRFKNNKYTIKIKGKKASIKKQKKTKDK